MESSLQTQRTASARRVAWHAALALAVSFGLAACGGSTLPSAASLTEHMRQLRQQAQPEFDALERERAAGTLSAAAYAERKAALEQRVGEDARDAAWARHSLAESERKALGLPTPDQPLAIVAPNALLGGAGGVNGSMYRPFTQQAQGAWNTNPTTGVIPTMNRMNNASTMYVQPPMQ